MIKLSSSAHSLSDYTVDGWINDYNPPIKMKKRSQPQCGMQIDVPGSYHFEDIAGAIMFTAQHRQSNKVCLYLISFSKRKKSDRGSQFSAFYNTEPAFQL